MHEKYLVTLQAVCKSTMNMSNTSCVKSSISALQNRGGYWRCLVGDSFSDRRYCMLSWLLAATSAFYWLATYGMPAICPSSPLEPHWNLIGT